MRRIILLTAIIFVGVVFRGMIGISLVTAQEPGGEVLQETSVSTNTTNISDTVPINTIETTTQVQDNSIMTILATSHPVGVIALIVVIQLGLFGALSLIFIYVNRIQRQEHQHQLLEEAVKKGRIETLLEREGITKPKEIEMYREHDLQRSKDVEKHIIDISNEIGEIIEELDGKTQQDPDYDRLDDLRLQKEEYLNEWEEELDAITVELENGRTSLEQIDKVKEEIKRINAEASQFTNRVLPSTLTVAGLGITGTFIIELTTILTIIFGIITLGLIGVLASAEIAPILAAIAGYVLGRAAGNGTS